MAVNVISPGLSTTVQDLGRPGYYHLGIPISGGMDMVNHSPGFQTPGKLRSPSRAQKLLPVMAGPWQVTQPELMPAWL